MTNEELAERCESATGAEAALDEAIQAALAGAEIEWQDYAKTNAYHRDGSWVSIGPILPYTGSIDAAMTLVPEGWNWMAGNRDQPKARAYVNNGRLHFIGAGTRRNPDCQWFEVVAATPALALCSASLRARPLT